MWPLSLTVSLRLSWVGSQKDLLDMLKCLRSSGLSASSVKLWEDNEDRRQDWTETQRDNRRPIRRATSCLGSFDWVDVKTTVVVVFMWTGNEAGPQLTASHEEQRRCRLHLIWDSLFSHFISEELIRWISVTALRSVALKPLLITMVTRSSLYRAEPLLRSICLIWSQFVRSRCSSTHSETCLHL